MAFISKELEIVTYSSSSSKLKWLKLKTMLKPGGAVTLTQQVVLSE